MYEAANNIANEAVDKVTNKQTDKTTNKATNEAISEATSKFPTKLIDNPTNKATKDGTTRTKDVVNIPNKTSVQAKVLIILQSDNKDNGRHATIAFATAVSALFANLDTTIFLTGSGVLWTRKGEMDDIVVKGYEPLHSYFNSFLLNGGHLLASIPCMQYNKRVDDFLERKGVLANVQCVGLSTLIHLTQESSVLTF